MGVRQIGCVLIVIAWLAGLSPVERASAATPPLANTKACYGKVCGVPKPAELPLRVPWKAGESHPFGDWGYNPANIKPGPNGSDHICNDGRTHDGKKYLNGAMDCYALDFVDLDFDKTEIYPAFGGVVKFAGCATGGWANYGQVVFIETQSTINGHDYEVFVTHLASISDAAKAAYEAHKKAIDPKTPAADKKKYENQSVIGVNTPLGKAGDTVTTGTDCTTRKQKMGVHIHFALYQDAIFNAGDGGPHGGNAVIPEPFIGLEAYENFQWWHPGETVKSDQWMVAADLADGTGSPTGDWKTAKPKAGTEPTPIPSNKPVPFQVTVKGNGAPLKEVHFTAYYPNWNDAADEGFPNFNEQGVWRVIAVCRPAGSPATKGCKWSGGATSATVTYDWYPYKEKDPTPAVVDWLPASHTLAAAAKLARIDTKQGYGICLSFDVVSAAGTVKLAPGGVNLANCGLDTASTDGSDDSGSPPIVPSDAQTSGPPMAGIAVPIAAVQPPRQPPA